MPDEIDQPETPTGNDPGLAALVMCLRFQGVAADPAQIAHRFGRAPIGVTEMLRCAKELGLKARVHRTRWERLSHTALPAIAPVREHGFLLIGKMGDDKALVQLPFAARPSVMTRTELEEVWDGSLGRVLN